MRGIASACGSATVINAIASGSGAAFAIDLRVEAKVELDENISQIEGDVGDTEEDSTLIETCVEKVLEKEGLNDQYGGYVETTADLPIAVGLSSSSAAANATVLATYDALRKNVGDLEAIDLGIEAAFEAGTTITGAYDDASASFLGGGVITDNEERKILKKFEVDPELKILVFLPSEKSYTTEIDVEKTRLLDEVVESVHQKALNGEIFGAQTVNGLLYSSLFEINPQPAVGAVEAGARCAGLTGTGPAIVAVCGAESVESVEDKWKEEASEIIVTNPSMEGARIENEWRGS